MIPRMHILHLAEITVLRYSASQKTKAHDNRELSFLPFVSVRRTCYQHERQHRSIV
jgi:hypothetical protein